MKTIYVKNQTRNWYVIDAENKPLGRVAAKAAAVLRGKNKATFTPNEEMGDYVVVINAAKVAVTGAKNFADQLMAKDDAYVSIVTFASSANRLWLIIADVPALTQKYWSPLSSI